MHIIQTLIEKYIKIVLYSTSKSESLIANFKRCLGKQPPLPVAIYKRRKISIQAVGAQMGQ